MEKARIILVGRNSHDIENVCGQILDVTNKTGVEVSGPIPMPTKRMKITTRKAPSGDGTETWERWEMRIYKRAIDIAADERSLRQIMRVQVPDTVRIEIELTG
ncbi:MAG: 30S ribosomal protein S10 [Candidatus Altiarchaeales archaeon IMC4]|nr:ribosomal protein S10 [uncultured archaeon]ODS42468.1 MAG: 30S ribosomal protein S10 [Candidatus Altiarchaeales archaeon IMC4]